MIHGNGIDRDGERQCGRRSTAGLIGGRGKDIRAICGMRSGRGQQPVGLKALQVVVHPGKIHQPVNRVVVGDGLGERHDSERFSAPRQCQVSGGAPGSLPEFAAEFAAPC